MTPARIVDDYVGLKCSSGLRFATQARILRSFARAAGPVDIEQVGQDAVLAFLNSSGATTTRVMTIYRDSRRMTRIPVRAATSIRARPPP